MKLPENASSIKFFGDFNVDVIEKRKKILQNIPDCENYQKAYKKIEKIRANKINPEMLPCYQSPLLTFSQEQHLFHKMNFYKYRTHQLIQSDKIFNKRLAKYTWSKAHETRNQIAESNFRLATQIIKNKNKTTIENNNMETTLKNLRRTSSNKAREVSIRTTISSINSAIV